MIYYLIFIAIIILNILTLHGIAVFKITESVLFIVCAFASGNLCMASLYRKVIKADLKEGEIHMFKKPIIPISRAKGEWIEALIANGILYADDNGIHVNEKSTDTDSKSEQC